jgi:predicted Zn-ribbon and HTH transcriptional regulator
MPFTKTKTQVAFSEKVVIRVRCKNCGAKFDKEKGSKCPDCGQE